MLTHRVTLSLDSPVAAIATLWLFLMGLVIGSFLNVVIARVPHGQSIVRPRSRCPRCGHTLSWWENIPVFSWLALRGKCRGCKLPISIRYPLIELLTALLFLACLRRFDWTLELALALVFICLLVPLTFIDLEHYLLPFALTLPGIAAGVVFSIPLGWPRLLDSLIGAAVGFGLFWLMEVVGEKVFKKEALGGGDKFLLAMIGAFLTWRPLLGVVFLSSLQGSVLSLIFIAVKGRAGPELPPSDKPPADVPPSVHPERSRGAPEDVPPVQSADASAPAHPERSRGAPEDGNPEVAPSAQPAAPLSGTPSDEEEDDWVPGPTNLPFGPYLALAALELLLLSHVLEGLLPAGTGWLVTGRF